MLIKYNNVSYNSNWQITVESKEKKKHLCFTGCVVVGKLSTAGSISYFYFYLFIYFDKLFTLPDTLNDDITVSL